jgi:tetratricopeptide (TPR) repeat protein
MGIQVHQEIAQHNAVVNPNCIRCLACKNACQNNTLSYRWGLNAISITRRINWLVPRHGNYSWYCDFLLIFCGLITAYYTQKWLGSFQTFLGAAWGLCFGIFMINILAKRYVPIVETAQQKRRLLTVGLITLSSLAWCWATSTSYDTRLLLRGNRFFDLMDYDKAIATYNQALNEFPSNHEIRAALALTYKQRGDYYRAVTEYKYLINSNPDNAALHNNLGTVYYRNEQYDLAIEEYRKAIQLDDNLVAAYGNLGLVFLKKGNAKEAIPFLRKVFQNEEDMLKYLLLFYNPNHEQTG